MRTLLLAFSLIKRIFYSTVIRFITHFNRLWAQNTWVKMINGSICKKMIDDSSRYTEVYLLGQKSEVPEKIKEYVRHVQTKFGKTPKKIRSDRGGEYTAERLQTFLKDEGIQAELFSR